MLEALAKVVIVSYAVLVAPLAVGQESALEMLEPRVTRQHFAVLIEAIDPEPTQGLVLDMVFDDYLTSIAELAHRADERADRVGRRTVQDALSGRLYVEAEELRRMRLDVLHAYADAWPEVDALLGELLANVEVSLDTEQARHSARAILALRREIILQPRREARYAFEYAGDGADLVRLLEEAAREDGPAPSGARLGPIREAYEADLDGLLRRTAPALRQARLERRMAGIRRQPQAIRAAEREILTAWEELHRLNERTAERIAESIEAAAGPAAAEHWRDRVDHATFPWLFTETTPDRQIAWIRRHAAEDASGTQAERVYTEYARELRRLREETAAMMVTGRTEHEVIAHPMMDPTIIETAPARAIYEQLVQQSGRIAQLERSTIESLESSLPAADRAAMRRAIGSKGRR